MRLKTLFNWIALIAFVLSTASAVVPHAQANDRTGTVISYASDHTMHENSMPCPSADFHCMLFGGGCAPMAMNFGPGLVTKMSGEKVAFFLEETYLQGRNLPSDYRPPRV